MTYQFGATSRELMQGMKPELVGCAEHALDFNIIDILVIPPYGGVRTEATQSLLVNRGKSKTMNSYHRVQEDGYGHAIDLGPYPLNWDDIDGFLTVAHLMRAASIERGVILTWGAVWDRRLHELGPNLKAEVDAYVQRRRSRGRGAFLDYPHFQYEGQM